MRSTERKSSSFPLYLHNKSRNAMRPENYLWMKAKNTLNDKDTITIVAINRLIENIIHSLFIFTTNCKMQRVLVIINEWNKENLHNDKDTVTIIAMRSTNRKYNSFPLYIHNQLQNAMRPGNYWWMKEKIHWTTKTQLKPL